MNEKPFLATAQARQGGVEAPYRGRGSITDTRRSNQKLGGAVAMGESTTRSIFDPLKPASGPGYFGLLDIRAPKHRHRAVHTNIFHHTRCHLAIPPRL